MEHFELICYQQGNWEVCI